MGVVVVCVVGGCGLSDEAKGGWGLAQANPQLFWKAKLLVILMQLVI